MGRCPICLRYANKKFFACPTCRTRYHVVCFPPSQARCYYCTTPLATSSKKRSTCCRSVLRCIEWYPIVALLWYVFAPMVLYHGLRSYGALDCENPSLSPFSLACKVQGACQEVCHFYQLCKDDTLGCRQLRTFMTETCSMLSLDNCDVLESTDYQKSIFTSFCTLHTTQFIECFKYLARCIYQGSCDGSVFRVSFYSS